MDLSDFKGDLLALAFLVIVFAVGCFTYVVYKHFRGEAIPNTLPTTVTGTERFRHITE